MTFSRTDKGTQTTLRVEGTLDASTSAKLQSAVNDIVADRRTSVIVDLAGLKMIDSSGVGVIVSLGKQMKAGGGDMTLQGLTGQPLTLFRTLGLDSAW